MIEWLFQNFAVCHDAARRAGLSATAELVVDIEVTLRNICKNKDTLLYRLTSYIEIC